LVQAGCAVELSQKLTSCAKTLVEALIEGQLTEQQLIQAQQALEDGDNSLDQAILSKLSAEGYAIEGATPLFSDVDELYSLLEEAVQAEA
ncbi:restriction endonuclease subunit S, partial [Escherichia coli]|nr:restriction endonuclease subunit S [Escherichia coli]